MKHSKPFQRTSGGRLLDFQTARRNAELKKRFNALGDECSFQEAIAVVRNVAGKSSLPTDISPAEWQPVRDTAAALSSQHRQAYILFNERPRPSISDIARALQLDREAVVRLLAQTYSGLSLSLPRVPPALDGPTG